MSQPQAALVTGAGGALGRAIASRLAADGHDVAVLDRDSASLEQTVEEVRKSGARVLPLTTDLRDAQAVEAAVERSASELGTLRVLVNNAAMYPSRPFLDVPLAEYEDVVAVNQRAYWVAAQAAARRMTGTGGGAIVNVASITMHGGWDSLAAYVSTKGAAVALTRALARELGPRRSASTASPPARSPRRPSRSTTIPRPIRGMSSTIRLSSGAAAPRNWPRPSPSSPDRTPPSSPASAWRSTEGG